MANIGSFIFTFLAYSTPYFSVTGMMILYLAYENDFKSQYILWPIGKYRFVCGIYMYMYIDVGLHRYIFLFMTLYKGPLLEPLSRLTYYAIINQ